MNGQLFENFREIFSTDPAGCSNCVSVFALTGRLLFCTGKPGHSNCRRRVRPFRAESFPLNLSGGFAVCGRRERAAPRGGGKKEGTPAVSLPLWTPTFPLLSNPAQIADM